MQLLNLLARLLGILQIVSTTNTRDLPMNGLFFSLSGTIYHHNDSVFIDDIGPDVMNRELPGDALVCNTTNVNTNCCRSIDNNGDGSIGNWFYPDNSPVIENSEAQARSADNIFVRIAYTAQVRLVARGRVAGPLGRYTCRVPTDDGEIVSGSIYIVSNYVKTTYPSTQEYYTTAPTTYPSTQEYYTTDAPTSNTMFSADSSSSSTNKDNVISGIPTDMTSSYKSGIHATMDNIRTSGTCSVIIGAAVMSVAAIIIVGALVVFIIVILLYKKTAKVNASKTRKEGIIDKANYEDIQLNEISHSKPKEILMMDCVAYGNISSKKEGGDELMAVYETV